ncbi:MAG: putative membrane protein [Flavobacteriales bacterium]|jgi:uncharacterized membrane protein
MSIFKNIQYFSSKAYSMTKNIVVAIKRVKEKLWFRPLVFCILSIIGALIAQLADSTILHELVPEIKTESLSELLNNISASMLVISIFAVGSMISAFSAASNTATPRSFQLTIADDVSKNALSVFIGSFIYSIVALVALKNGYYGRAGHFVLFVFTLLFFALVIITFLRWVDRISKLGRMGHTIKLVEDATAKAIRYRLQYPTLKGLNIVPNQKRGVPIYSTKIGYVQLINMQKLQAIAKKLDILITLNAVPGTFIALDIPLFYVGIENKDYVIDEYYELRTAFTLGDMRYFEEDPRFGLITLSEIASRALSPAVNDPGTAIQIISSHIRLFSLYNNSQGGEELQEEIYTRIAVPQLAITDLFEDAFRPIARDGAANIEVMIRLQKAFRSISKINHNDMTAVAMTHSLQAFSRAEKIMAYKEDIIELKNKSIFNTIP